MTSESDDESFVFVLVFFCLSWCFVPWWFLSPPRPDFDHEALLTFRLPRVSRVGSGFRLGWSRSAEPSKFDPTAETLKLVKAMKVAPGDWPMWGGSYFRNNTPKGRTFASEWDVSTATTTSGRCRSVPKPMATRSSPTARCTSAPTTGRLPQTLSGQGRFGCLICYEESTGKFLWQASSEKLADRSRA